MNRLIYLYATELMPTLLRTYGVGTASMVGRLGSASAPFIVDLVVYLLAFFQLLTCACVHFSILTRQNVDNY